MIVFLIEIIKDMNTSFERCELTKVEWLTPPELVKKLGDFDLDPCSPINAPFLHAKTNYTIKNDGLTKEWFGRVYCNPPYGKHLNLWLEKLKNHGNGIALIFARTETKCFFENVWNSADALLFVKGRIRFYHVSGKTRRNSGRAERFHRLRKGKCGGFEKQRYRRKVFRIIKFGRR